MKILYLCDRQNHCEHPCYAECYHTQNEEWAKYPPQKRIFVSDIRGDFWEISDWYTRNEEAKEMQFLDELWGE